MQEFCIENHGGCYISFSRSMYNIIAVRAIWAKEDLGGWDNLLPERTIAIFLVVL
jgi:hypothetical protein